MGLVPWKGRRPDPRPSTTPQGQAVCPPGTGPRPRRLGLGPAAPAWETRVSFEPPRRCLQAEAHAARGVGGWALRLEVPRGGPAPCARLTPASLSVNRCLARSRVWELGPGVPGTLAPQLPAHAPRGKWQGVAFDSEKTQVFGVAGP